MMREDDRLADEEDAMARRTVYQPLIDHLAASTAPVVWLTFAEIERILGTRLPPSARTHASFWTRSGNAHVRGWRAFGWGAHFSRHRAFIHFTREAEG